MADDELALAELLCARLVHDLSGPVGAVANGAELLEDESAADLAGEAIALLGTSAVAAIARLKFLRLALGAAGQMAPAEQRKLAQDYFTKGAAGEAIGLDWPPALDAGLAALPARLVLNLLMLARDCLPRGGTLKLAAAGGAFSVTAEGTNAAPGEAAKGVAATSAAELTPRGAQGYLAAKLAARAGWKITLAPQAGRVTVTLAKS